MYKNIIIAFVTVSSVSVFNLIFFPPVFIKILNYGAPVIMLSIILLHGVYDKSPRFKPTFRIEMTLIWVAVILSMFGAYSFHNQDFGISVQSQRFMYYLLFYPLLHILKPKPEELSKIIIYLGLIYAGLYILQTIAYPVKLVDVVIFNDRGTRRITLAGSGFLFLSYLFAMTNFIKTYDKKYLFICLLAIVIFMLLGMRQVIAPLVFLTLLSILFNKKVKSRALFVFLLILMAFPVYFLFQDIFTALFEISQKQAGNITGDVRYKALMFYLFKFSPHKLAYITGNGVAGGLSPYGKELSTVFSTLHYFQSDIGIFGDFSKFGIVFVTAVLSIYIRIAFMRLPGDLEYIKLFAIASLMTIMTGSTFVSADFIVIVCIILYLADMRAYYDPVNKSDALVLRGKETINSQ